MPPWARVMTIRCKRLSPSRTRRGSLGTIPLADAADSTRMTACSTMTVLFGGEAGALVVKEHQHAEGGEGQLADALDDSHAEANQRRVAHAVQDEEMRPF